MLSVVEASMDPSAVPQDDMRGMTKVPGVFPRHLIVSLALQSYPAFLVVYKS